MLEEGFFDNFSSKGNQSIVVVPQEVALQRPYWQGSMQ